MKQSIVRKRHRSKWCGRTPLQLVPGRRPPLPLLPPHLILLMLVLLVLLVLVLLVLLMLLGKETVRKKEWMMDSCLPPPRHPHCRALF